ncbi:hypothetical protein K0M31_003270 [Melipona bicolor]|uniref:Uncharacterized protein n=1 Tax=Melipona bicolor TaxID=60889 RepID=A0AA40FYX5_9HYME|nr:hypothetical protein K0M31_003270 [Melipona bicolor]
MPPRTFLSAQPTAALHTQSHECIFLHRGRKPRQSGWPALTTLRFPEGGTGRLEQSVEGIITLPRKRGLTIRTVQRSCHQRSCSTMLHTGSTIRLLTGALARSLVSAEEECSSRSPSITVEDTKNDILYKAGEAAPNGIRINLA